VEHQLRSTNYDCVVVGACRPATLRYSKWSSTLFVGSPQVLRLPSIHGPMIAPMLPPEGWRLEAELYSSSPTRRSRGPVVDHAGQTGEAGRALRCECRDTFDNET
jgi:hypothetical protein